MKRTLRALAILSVIVSVIWMVAVKTFDPILAFIASVGTLITVFAGDSKEETEDPNKHNRRILLSRVDDNWIKSVLKKSLYGAGFLGLGIKEEPRAIKTNIWRINPESTGDTLLANIAMPKITKQISMGKSLLILGAPGSGKTTILLELARNLIEHAWHHEAEPIPLVFNLSSWTEKLPLSQWLAQELNRMYGIPKGMAPSWINGNKLHLLLDGLDEIQIKHRIHCIDAINQFINEHGLTSIIVCSRSQDYQNLNTKLSVGNAIEIQPLTSRQVNTYFNDYGEGQMGLKHALKKDAVLLKMAEIPLYLNIMMMAYRDMPVELLVSENLNTIESRHRHLFETYVQQMYKRASKAKKEAYSLEQTRQQLAWLARKMTAYNPGMYFIESMQGSWLDIKKYRRYRLWSGLTAGLIGTVFGGIICALYILLGAPKNVLVYGILPGLFFGLIGANAQITLFDSLGWSWGEVRKKIRSSLFSGVLLGIITWTIAWVFAVWLSTDAINKLGIIAGLSSGVMNAISHGLTGKEISETTYPGQKIAFSVKSYIIVFILTWLVTGISIGLAASLLGYNGLITGSAFGLIVGMMCGLGFGGLGIIQYYVLRLVITSYRLLPWQLVPFLDFCANLFFLRRVGGGYIFRHPFLMDYFAELNTESQ